MKQAKVSNDTRRRGTALARVPAPIAKLVLTTLLVGKAIAAHQLSRQVSVDGQEIGKLLVGKMLID